MSNLARLQAAMASAGSPALLISDLANVNWLTDFSGSAGMVVVTPTDARFLTDSRYTIQAKEQVKSMPSFTFAAPVEMPDFLASQVKDMGISKLGFESGSVVYDTFIKWKSKLDGVDLQPAPNVLGPLRMVKSEDEIATVRRACGLADACFDHVKRLIQPGVAEFDIHLEIEFYFRRNKAELAFTPIVVSGERSARPHGKASDKRLEVGDFVTMDFGAQVDGLCSDLTRTVVVGEASDRHREIYNAVLEAEVGAIAAIKPGARAADVDKLARDILGKYELAQYFGHGLGHGLGRVVHDLGRMNASSQDVFEVGQIWTVEPGVYIPGFGGVRIEDDVLVTEGGVEILTKSPKELLVLPE